MCQKQAYKLYNIVFRLHNHNFIKFLHKEHVGTSKLRSFWKPPLFKLVLLIKGKEWRVILLSVFWKPVHMRVILNGWFIKAILLSTTSVKVIKAIQKDNNITIFHHIKARSLNFLLVQSCEIGWNWINFWEVQRAFPVNWPIFFFVEWKWMKLFQSEGLMFLKPIEDVQHLVFFKSQHFQLFMRCVGSPLDREKNALIYCSSRRRST